MATETPHEFASTQVNIADPHAVDVLAYAASIPDAEIDPVDGREMTPHVTVKYGLHCDGPEDVRKLMQSETAPVLTLGKMSIFPASENRPSDVLKVDVHSPELHRLNKTVAASIEHTDTHQGYQPHMTIAYLKPGEGAKYVGDNTFEGRKIRPSHLVFSGKDRTQTAIPFGGNQTIGLDRSDSIAVMLAGPDTEYRAALTLGSDWSWPKTRNGKPCHYYWKESLAPGRFQDAKGDPFTIHESPDTALSASSDGRNFDLDTIISTFKAARASGFEPPLPDAHEAHNRKRNFGFVVDARKNEKGNLELLHQFIGDQEANDALNLKTSVFLVPELTDFKNRKFRQLLDHNAMVYKPVISDLSDFKPALAASRDLAIDAVCLHRVADIPSTGGTMPLSPEMLARARSYTGMDNLAEADALAEVLRVGEQSKQQSVQLSRDLVAANESKAAIEREKAELSRKNPASVPPTAGELYFASQAVEAKRKQAIDSGAITVAVADQAKARFLKKPVEFSALSLSREVESDDIKLREGLAHLCDFYDAVAGNVPSPKSNGHAQTDQQRAVALGRPEFGTGESIGKDTFSRWDKEDEEMKQRELARTTSR